ncbi:MAG: LacI family transcriptional regulator [Bacteroidia bacterium]|nr:LacI family transcriptional regulator [Bacteroidia bacterium]
MRKKQVTILELATRLGLSASTVSRALNGRHRISEETQQRVKALAMELGYRPNVSARHLRENRTYTIGVLFPHLQSPFFANILEELVAEARVHHHHLILQVGEEGVALQFLLNAHLDGILLLDTPNETTAAKIEAIRARQLPFVLLGAEDKSCIWIKGNARQVAGREDIMGLSHEAFRLLLEEIDAMEHGNASPSHIIGG